jgi:hypothetical protein
MHCHLFLNVNGVRSAHHRNKYVSTETNGVDLKHFEMALTPFDHTSSIATNAVRLATSRHLYPSAPNEWPSNDEQHRRRHLWTAHTRAAIGDSGGMIASTALGIIFVPLLFIIVRSVFKDRHARRNTRQEADPTPETIRP